MINGVDVASQYGEVVCSTNWAIHPLHFVQHTETGLCVCDSIVGSQRLNQHRSPFTLKPPRTFPITSQSTDHPSTPLQ